MIISVKKQLNFRFGTALRRSKILKVRNSTQHTRIPNLHYLIAHQNRAKFDTKTVFSFMYLNLRIRKLNTQLDK